MSAPRVLPTAILLVIALIVAATPAAAMAKKAKVDLQTEQTAAITEGDEVWISLMWTAEGDADNVRVTVDKLPRAVTASYPANTGDHSGPMHGYELSDGELDFTAIRLAVPHGTDDFKLRATVTWETEGKTVRKRFQVKVPVIDHEGGDLEQLTTSADVPTDADTWLDVWYSGLAPRVENFSLDIADQPDLDLTYPGHGTTTSLHNDALLEDGESDVARVLVDADGVEPGTYQLDITVTYDVAGETRTLDGTLDVRVTD